MLTYPYEVPFFGFGGPKPDLPLDLPAVQLPRGIDNSAGAPVWVADPRMGPIAGHWVHLSFGAGTAGLVLRDRTPARTAAAASRRAPIPPCPASSARGPTAGGSTRPTAASTSPG